MKAIIFDVDDVLIDASVSRTVKYKLVFDELNLEFTDSLKNLIYNNINNYFTKLFCGNTGDSNQKENNIKQAIEFLNSQGINNNEISIVDDRIQAGIVLGKKYGIHRIRFNFGVHSNNEYVPDKVINSLSEIE